jgi:hypothetical protein
MIRTLVKRLPRLAAGACAVALLAGAAAAAEPENDYPTEARADYIFGCMAANGQSRESLSRCSCSLDALAALLPYDKYVQASTVLSIRQGIGQRPAPAWALLRPGIAFKDSGIPAEDAPRTRPPSNSSIPCPQTCRLR